MNTVTFFNNKGGVGKITMVYHIAWMLAELGKRVVAIDLDPQSNLSAMFLDDDRLGQLVERKPDEHLTVLDSIVPVTEGEGYVPVHIEAISEKIGLVVGDLALSTFADRLSDAWLKCLNRDIYAFRITSVFDTIIADARDRWDADIVVVDIGPNLGAINRAVTISSDYIILPVASDLFSLQGIKNLGMSLINWRADWNKRREENPKPGTLKIPDASMHPSRIHHYAVLRKREATGQVLPKMGESYPAGLPAICS
jgi:cellulose biosynthesis protein BcsQ